jgi:hypothetical protein
MAERPMLIIHIFNHRETYNGMDYRPMRNWMIKMFVWNLRAVRRLTAEEFGVV